MKWYVIIPSILFSFSSCSRNADIPVEIIKAKQMQALIWDIARADAYSDVLHQKDTINTLSKISMNLTDNLLALHKTNRTQVENSFKFYSKHPDIFKILLDSLNDQQTRKNISEAAKPVQSPLNLIPK